MKILSPLSGRHREYFPLSQHFSRFTLPKCLHPPNLEVFLFIVSYKKVTVTL